ncbi:MAG: alpha/beta hydrolase [Myxococcota bacterium]
MVNTETDTAALAMCDRLLAAKPIVGAVEPGLTAAQLLPPRLSPARDVLEAFIEGLQLLPSSRGSAPTGAGSDELLLQLHAYFASELGAASKLADQGLDAQIIARSLPRWTSQTFDARFRGTDLRTPDGATIRAFAAPGPRDRTIVIASACGMLGQLTRPWLDEIGGEYQVLTWTSRGLFGTASPFDEAAARIEDQATDIVALLDHYDVPSAHIMGICGGTSMAVAAAAAAPGRVHSLSLWHGDYDLGDEAPRTEHQTNLIELLSIARRSRDSATQLLEMIRSTPLDSIDTALSPVLLYPYANAELLYRYAWLNGSIMSTDLRPTLARVRQRSLVVTSQDDHTAHPEGSRVAASKLADSTMHESGRGDHLSMFSAPPDRVALARSFLDSLTWP